MSYEIFCACNNVSRNNRKLLISNHQIPRVINLIQGLRTRAKSRHKRYHYTLLNSWNRRGRFYVVKNTLIKRYASLGCKARKITRKLYAYRGIT